MTARLLIILFAAVTSLLAQAPSKWDRWQFVIGDWAGEGTGKPGQGSGSFSFQPQLDNRILVRKNRADYPAAKERPAYSHEDLMIVYPEGASPRAIYFDNEGHVIHYSAEFADGGDRIVFTSETPVSSPRFRLIYSKLGPGKVGIRFEIAPPGRPDAFSPYIEATARRK